MNSNFDDTVRKVIMKQMYQHLIAGIASEALSQNKPSYQDF